MINSRRSAVFALTRWLQTHDFPTTLLPEGPDRAFVQDVVYTSIRRLRPLRRILGGFVKKWPKGELEALLYVGAAQLLYMKDVPDFAAVSETVEAAKACGNPAIAKVVNGVLRNLIRHREELDLGTELETFPSALSRRWVARFGSAEAERLAVWHNTPAETFLARRDGSFVSLERGRKVKEVEGYEEGEFIVQDPATALAVKALDVAEGCRVLDYCAAPGGKTIQIAWRGGVVTACEVNPRRRERLLENLRRVRLESEVRVLAEPPSGETFDRVLVDAPCSNSGVLRRRPDARWNWNEEKLAALVKLQSEILDAAANRVAAGGKLVYSTCSNEPEENGEQVAAFLSRHPDFVQLGAEESVPTVSGHDGAFAAVLVRNLV